MSSSQTRSLAAMRARQFNEFLQAYIELNKNRCQDLIIHPTQSNAARKARYKWYMAVATGRQRQVKAGMRFLDLPQCILFRVVSATLVRSFYPRTIEITNREIKIHFGKFTISSGRLNITDPTTFTLMLEELVVKQLMAQVLDASRAQGEPTNRYDIAKTLTAVVTKEVVKSCVFTMASNFPSAGHPSRQPLPACLTSHKKLIDHVNFTLTLSPGSASRIQYYYPADLYTLQNQVGSIKDYMPFVKTIHVSVTEIIGGYTPSKTYVVRRTVSAPSIAQRLQTRGSFACEEETTVTEELEVLEAIMRSIPDVKEASVSLVKVD